MQAWNWDIIVSEVKPDVVDELNSGIIGPVMSCSLDSHSWLTALLLQCLYTCVQKKTPTHIFFHISTSDV